MPTFKYKAISKDGQNIEGIIEAFDEFEAVATIRQTCNVVTDIRSVQSKSTKSILQMEIGSGKVKEKPLSLLCSQFAIVLTAGLPMVRCVQLISEQTTDKGLKKILNSVSEDVAAGYGLAQSFENKAKKKLPDTFIETLRAGEQAGTLEVAFRKLHTYYDRTSKVKNKVQSAMAYPIFLAVVAVIVIGIIMVVAVPMFASTFASMNVELPLMTRILIAVSGFTKKYILFILIGIGVLIGGLKFYNGTPAGRLKQGERKMKMPILGKVNRMKCASQFANTMSTLLAAGLPMTRTVAATAKSLDNYFVGTQLGKVVGDLEEGKPLAASLNKCVYLPNLLIEMTSVGEETGSMESTLDVVGNFYDNEVETSTAKALSLLEPAIICVMAVFIIIILLSVYLPIFSLYGNIGA